MAGYKKRGSWRSFSLDAEPGKQWKSGRYSRSQTMVQDVENKLFEALEMAQDYLEDITENYPENEVNLEAKSDLMKFIKGLRATERSIAGF